MTSNIDKYKEELDRLFDRGNNILSAVQFECHPKEFLEQYRKDSEIPYSDYIKSLPSSKFAYQSWYSEAHAVIKQLLPDRLSDFVRLYEKLKTRKTITYSNYVMEDYLQGTRVTLGGQTQVSPSAAIPQLVQQIAILLSAKARFKSSLFEIKQLVQADLLDSEIDAARVLAKNKFFRAAGAIIGVVIEKHLAQVAINHNVTIKKRPTISDLNDALKTAEVIEVAQWRFIQHLGDLRNLCDHNKEKEPTAAEIEDLINGSAKISKTIF
jgi:hypothetical protein